MEFDGVEDVVNVFQLQHTTGVAVTDAQAVADIGQFMDDLYVILEGILTILMIAREIKIFNKTQLILLGAYPFPTFNGGLQVLPPTAPGVAILSNFATGIPRVTPRKYWGVMTETSMDTQGQWEVPTLAVIATANSLLLAEYIGVNSNWQYGYFSPKIAGFAQPNSAIVTSIPAYQRRRKQGRGS
jgi:hypothetical protein